MEKGIKRKESGMKEKIKKRAPLSIKEGKKKGASEELKREDLVRALRRLKPGLGKGMSGTDYDSNFLFRTDRIGSYSDEVAVQCFFPVGVECSVEGEKLLTALSKVNREFLNMSVDGGKGQLIIKAGRQSFGLVLNAGSEGLSKRLDSFDYEGMKWRKVPKGFQEGLRFCSYSASKDAIKPYLMGVCVQGKDLLSSDNYRISWFELGESLTKERVLVPAREYLKVSDYPCEKFSLEEGWIHFMGEGLYYSLHLLGLSEEYPADAARAFFPKKVDATRQFSIPKSFSQALDNSLVIDRDRSFWDREVKIFSREGTLYCRSEAEVGDWYEEGIEFFDKVSNFSVALNPVFLSDILKYEGKAYLVDDHKIMFVSDSFKHLISF